MAEVQYPSNSNKSKQMQQEPKIQGQVQGGVQLEDNVAKKLWHSFIVPDIKEATNGFFWTKLVPSIKGMLVSNLHVLINTLTNWNGTTPTSGQQTNYNAVSTVMPIQAVNPVNVQQQIGTPKASDLAFMTEDDAKNVRNWLIAAIAEKQYVSVNTLYGWIGKQCDPMFTKFGWINITEQNTKVYQRSDGWWVLQLPKASPLD